MAHWQPFFLKRMMGYVLKYDEYYLNQPDCKPISLTLPKQKEASTSKTLFAFFDGLIPEGWLLDIAVDHWKVKASDRFKLLLTKTGRL